MRLTRRLILPALLLCLSAFPAQRLAARQAKSGQTARPAASSADLLDINTATRDQLKALPGIGDAYADRIIKGRPYYAKNQLTMNGVLPDATYQKIRDKIIAKRAAK